MPPTTTARISSTRVMRALPASTAEAGLHHADQPRRGCGSSRHAARVAGLRAATRSRRSTARRGIRSPSASSSRRRTQSAPTYSATATIPSTVEDVSGALGRGGYEGIQNDSDGNIWIVEDIGGAIKTGTTARRSRTASSTATCPAHPGDLAARQAAGPAGAERRRHPITVESQTALNAPDQVALHTYGKIFSTKWVTIHDTAVDGNAPFNANTLAKAAHGTPFKRPENGVFRPGTRLRRVLLHRDR